jgi:hypothetical protein
LAFSDKQPESAGVLPQYPALAAASQLALSAALGAGSAWLMSVGLMASRGSNKVIIEDSLNV